jgi:hypothetical protein
MTSKARSVTISLSALISAIIVIGGAAWGGGAKVVALADTRYANRDTFVNYRNDEQLRRALDSTTVRAELVAVRAILAGLDSSDRCRRNQRNFCR